jgi:membrane protein required for colicin V production
MQTYDLIMLAVLVAATIFGARKGLAWQIASLASIFASYFIAYKFREPVAQMIQTAPPWNTFLAMLIVYLAASLLIWLAFRFVSEVINRVRLKEFDTHAGAVLGLARGALWCVIITLFAFTLLGEREKQAIVGSRSGYYIALLLDKAGPLMPTEVHDVLGPYIRSLDARVEQNMNLPNLPGAPSYAGGYAPGGGYPPVQIPSGAGVPSGGNGGYPAGGYAPGGGYPAVQIPPAAGMSNGSTSGGYPGYPGRPSQSQSQFGGQPAGSTGYGRFP